MSGRIGIMGRWNQDGEGWVGAEASQCQMESEGDGYQVRGSRCWN